MMIDCKIERAILNRLKANDPSLTGLDLSDRELTDSDIEMLMQALIENTNLTTLNVGSNQIGDIGAEALSRNVNLTYLDVSYDQIGDEGAKALALNRNLTSLNVAGNTLGDEGGQALAQNVCLRTLDFSRNNITDASTAGLEQMILRNQEAAHKRRQHWYCTVLLLATAQGREVKENSVNWTGLPRDIRQMIIKLIELKGPEGLDKTSEQLRQASAYIFANRKDINDS
jgi:hypothetical protein